LLKYSAEKKIAKFRVRVKFKDEYPSFEFLAGVVFLADVVVEAFGEIGFVGEEALPLYEVGVPPTPPPEPPEGFRETKFGMSGRPMSRSSSSSSSFRRLSAILSIFRFIASLFVGGEFIGTLGVLFGVTGGNRTALLGGTFLGEVVAKAFGL
jgi:hypothetical protein